MSKEIISPSQFNHCHHSKSNKVHIEGGEGNEVVFIFQDRSFAVDADELVDVIYRAVE